MKREDMLKSFDSLIESKVEELREHGKELRKQIVEEQANAKQEGRKASCAKSTQLSANSLKINTLRLIKDLLTGEISQLSHDTLVRLTNPSGEGVSRLSVDFNEGDAFMYVAYEKYKDVKHISDKIEKVCERKGLKLDTSTGIFVKA